MNGIKAKILTLPSQTFEKKASYWVTPEPQMSKEKMLRDLLGDWGGSGRTGGLQTRVGETSSSALKGSLCEHPRV